MLTKKIMPSVLVACLAGLAIPALAADPAPAKAAPAAAAAAPAAKAAPAAPAAPVAKAAPAAPAAASAEPMERKDCAVLKSEIAAKITANGVKVYSLEAVAIDAKVDGKIVGNCDGQTKQLVYKRGGEMPAAAAKPAAK